jgi:hypothetical protein
MRIDAVTQTATCADFDRSTLSVFGDDEHIVGKMSRTVLKNSGPDLTKSWTMSHRRLWKGCTA